MTDSAMPTSDPQRRGGRPSSAPRLTDATAREAFLSVRLSRSTPEFRKHAESLLSWATGTSEHDQLRRAALVSHLHGMIDEMWRWRELAETTEQGKVRALNIARYETTRADTARRTLLAGLERIEQTIDRVEVELGLGREADWAARMRAATTRAHIDYREVWE